MKPCDGGGAGRAGAAAVRAERIVSGDPRGGEGIRTVTNLESVDMSKSEDRSAPPPATPGAPRLDAGPPFRPAAPQPPPAPARRPYAKPALTVHGSLVQLTRGGNFRVQPETFYTTTGPAA